MKDYKIDLQCISYLNFTFNFEIIENYLDNNAKFLLNNKDKDIRIDFCINIKKYIRIYGNIFDENKNSRENIFVSLIKYENEDGILEKKILEKYITNEFGEFNFLIDFENNIENYSIDILGALVIDK